MEPSDREPAIRVLMMPRDTNPLGTIFGGLVSFFTDARLIGTTSVTVKVLVWAQRFSSKQLSYATEALVMLVAVDYQRRKVPIAKSDVETGADEPKYRSSRTTGAASLSEDHGDACGPPIPHQRS